MKLSKHAGFSFLAADKEHFLWILCVALYNSIKHMPTFVLKCSFYPNLHGFHGRPTKRTKTYIVLTLLTLSRLKFRTIMQRILVSLENTIEKMTFAYFAVIFFKFAIKCNRSLLHLFKSFLRAQLTQGY